MNLADHRLIVDRFEESVAVVSVDGVMFDLPRWLLPSGAKEGSVLLATADGVDAEARIVLRVDAEATAQATARAKSALSRFSQGDPGGDIEL